MVRLEKVNKYFNRRKKNEIHVINNTSLELENKGLVALLGPSGCGKTTLLNVIGGLDKVNKGRVYVNGQKITGRRTGKIDSIRNLNIGYIFQNYNLVDNMTVFDNVAIALKMVLYIVLIVMALLISGKFARSLFKKTALGSFREED